jgi:hypothetical protein
MNNVCDYISIILDNFQKSDFDNYYKQKYLLNFINIFCNKPVYRPFIDTFFINQKLILFDSFSDPLLNNLNLLHTNYYIYLKPYCDYFHDNPFYDFDIYISNKNNAVFIFDYFLQLAFEYNASNYINRRLINKFYNDIKFFYTIANKLFNIFQYFFYCFIFNANTDIKYSIFLIKNYFIQIKSMIDDYTPSYDFFNFLIHAINESLTIIEKPKHDYFIINLYDINFLIKFSLSFHHYSIFFTFYYKYIFPTNIFLNSDSEQNIIFKNYIFFKSNFNHLFLDNNYMFLTNIIYNYNNYKLFISDLKNIIKYIRYIFDYNYNIIFNDYNCLLNLYYSNPYLNSNYEIVNNFYINNTHFNELIIDNYLFICNTYKNFICIDNFFKFDCISFVNDTFTINYYDNFFCYFDSNFNFVLNNTEFFEYFYHLFINNIFDDTSSFQNNGQYLLFNLLPFIPLNIKCDKFLVNFLNTKFEIQSNIYLYMFPSGISTIISPFNFNNSNIEPFYFSFFDICYHLINFAFISRQKYYNTIYHFIYQFTSQNEHLKLFYYLNIFINIYIFSIKRFNNINQDLILINNYSLDNTSYLFLIYFIYFLNILTNFDNDTNDNIFIRLNLDITLKLIDNVKSTNNLTDIPNFYCDLYASNGIKHILNDSISTNHTFIDSDLQINLDNISCTSLLNIFKQFVIDNSHFFNDNFDLFDFYLNNSIGNVNNIDLNFNYYNIVYKIYE